MKDPKTVQWAYGGERCNLCMQPAVWSGLCESCHAVVRDRRPCGECGLLAMHSVTCPYLLRLEAIYAAARAYYFSGVEKTQRKKDIALGMAIQKQIATEGLQPVKGVL